MTGNDKSKLYTAIYTKSGMTTCTVIASNESEAVEKLKDQLTRNASRLVYYNAWKQNGFKVKIK